MIENYEVIDLDRFTRDTLLFEYVPLYAIEVYVSEMEKRASGGAARPVHPTLDEQLKEVLERFFPPRIPVQDFVDFMELFRDRGVEWATEYTDTTKFRIIPPILKCKEDSKEVICEYSFGYSMGRIEVLLEKFNHDKEISQAIFGLSIPFKVIIKIDKDEITNNIISGFSFVDIIRIGI